MNSKIGAAKLIFIHIQLETIRSRKLRTQSAYNGNTPPVDNLRAPCKICMQNCSADETKGAHGARMAKFCFP